MKNLRFLSAAGLVLALLAIIWTSNIQPKRVELIPSLTGEPEYCLSCHAELAVISPSHPIETFGCVICHGGQRLALDADLAHSTMRGGDNPSRLNVAEQSCGGEQCHSGEASAERNHIQRVLTSIQVTYAGAIASIRYTFGAQPDLQAQFAVKAVRDFDRTKSGISSLAEFDPKNENHPSILAFAENCLTCHIGAEPIQEQAYQRLTGCAACHTPTTGKNLENEEIHQLTTAIPYSQCNTCHNRGNYDLRDMKFHPRSDHPADRMNDYYQPISQFVRCEWTLDCIDCHTRQEIMGDGDLYSSQAEVQYVQCKTCHGTINELPRTQIIRNEQELAFRMIFLNPVIDLRPGDTILATEKGEPLWNIRLLADGTYELKGKASGKSFSFRPVMGSGCEQDVDEQNSSACHKCHDVDR